MKSKEWNCIDQLIYSFENFLKKGCNAMPHKEEDIDAETMIAAETEHLKSENEKLKKLQMPGRIICKDEKYYCPHCQKEIHSLLVEQYKTKHCPECGKRIILSIPYDYIAREN